VPLVASGILNFESMAGTQASWSLREAAMRCGIIFGGRSFKIVMALALQIPHTLHPERGVFPNARIIII
jgi:hypothetical protein